MADHAKFSPSKMHRLIPCPGSFVLESQFEDKRNDYADEGTVAHDVAAHCLRSGLDATGWVGLSADVDARGNVSPKDDDSGKFKIDEEFAAHVQTYLDTVRRLANGKILLVEQRVDFSETVGVKNQFGTSDCIIIDTANRHLIVGDLKFGMGVKVFAERNAQMLTYAAAVLETFADTLPPIDKITMFISQPRIDHYDEWTCDMEELKRFVATMRNAILTATVAMKDWEADRELIPEYFGPGKKQCTFCKAEGVCPARAQWVAQQVMDDFKALDEPNRLVVQGKLSLPSVELLGARYGVLDEIESWCRAVRAECERMVFAGMDVIGPDGLPMKLVEGKRGNRTWIDERAAEGVLAGHLPPDKLYKPRKLLTPSEADKLLNKKKTAEVWKTIEPLYKQAPGQPSVTLGSDPRPPWSGEAKSDQFPDLSADDL